LPINVFVRCPGISPSDCALEKLKWKSSHVTGLRFLTNCGWTVGDFPLRDDVFSGMSLPGSAKCGKKDFGDLIAQSAAQAGIERALKET